MFFLSIPFPFMNGHHNHRHILAPGTTLHLARAKISSSTTPSTTTTITTDPSTTIKSSDKKICSKRNGRGLPFEGKLYDKISMSNFLDLDKYKAMASLTKSIPINSISSLLDADLPAKLSFSGKLGTFGTDGLKISPIARVGFNLRLLDLGAPDTRQKGFLRYKISARTDHRVDHGFEIDRKVEMFSLPHTTLYGNVNYKTSNRNENGHWKTISSFGIHQDLNFAGIKFAARVGLTPEGTFVYDLKL